MESVFNSFCAFGAGQQGEAQMDNAKFAKFARDMKLLDKNLTATDIDIMFSKIKVKNERKISYMQFKEGLKLISQKKYPGDPDGVKKLEEKILSGKGPQAVGATRAVQSDAVDRLTDASKYTGTHKERFDETGKGKGMAGRYQMDEATQKAKEGYVGGYKHMGTYDESH